MPDKITIKTEAGRFDDANHKLFIVFKQEMGRREADWQGTQGGWQNTEEGSPRLMPSLMDDWLFPFLLLQYVYGELQDAVFPHCLALTEGERRPSLFSQSVGFKFVGDGFVYKAAESRLFSDFVNFMFTDD